MKCESCGYTYEKKISYVDKAVLFKTGKNKGKVKDVVNEGVVLEVGHTPFKKLSLVIGVKFNTLECVNFIVCPDCKTMVLDMPNDEFNYLDDIL